MELEQRVETAIRNALSRAGGPVKIRDLQSRSANRAWGPSEFRSTLEALIRRGVVWHEDGVVELLDREWVPPKHTSALPNSADLGFTRSGDE